MIFLLFIATQHLRDCVSFISATEIHDVAPAVGTLWCGTGGGIAIFDRTTESYSRITYSEGLPSNSVIQVESDGYGHIWCLCRGGGMIVFCLYKFWLVQLQQWATRS